MGNMLYCKWDEVGVHLYDAISAIKLSDDATYFDIYDPYADIRIAEDFEIARGRLCQIMRAIADRAIEGSKPIVNVFLDMYDKWNQANAMGKVISDRLVLRWQYVLEQMKRQK
jgi:hypothetical protein